MVFSKSLSALCDDDNEREKMENRYTEHILPLCAFMIYKTFLCYNLRLKISSTCPKIVENPFDDDVIISKEKFPKVIQERINGDGIKTQIAIFSITEDGTNTIVSNFTDKM